jgi:hypothetical protein
MNSCDVDNDIKKPPFALEARPLTGGVWLVGGVGRCFSPSLFI